MLVAEAHNLEITMTLATWWDSDPVPHLTSHPNFRAAPATDDAEMAHLNGIALGEARLRRQQGHRPYIARVGGEPAAYGWVATQRAEIGELGLAFAIGARERYLWDFATRVEWQGHGLYPRLLQAILTIEARTADRLWIIHAPENLPSGAGMEKAGFCPVGRLSYLAAGGVALAPSGVSERAEAGAAFLGVALVSQSLTPCWRCGADAGTAGCSCCSTSAPDERCACAITPRPSVVQIG